MRILLDTNIVLDVLLERAEWLAEAETMAHGTRLVAAAAIGYEPDASK